MSVFAYTAVSKDGRRTNGTLTSDSRAGAMNEITRQGLHPLTLEEAENAEAAARKAREAAVAGGAKLKVPGRVVEAFTREMANLLAGGVPLARSLALLSREASTPSAKHVLGSIHDDVVGGVSLADAMARWPRTFSVIHVAMVRAGEAGGFLETVLNQIADFRSRERDLLHRVLIAMVYPMFLAVLAIGVVILLMTFFIPRFSVIFQDSGQDLPALTRAIIFFSHLVTHDGLIVAGLLVVGGVVLHRATTGEAGRRRREVALLSVPYVNVVIARFALVRFARMLGTLIGAGVPLVASLRVAREAIGNQTLSDTVLLAMEEVQRGKALSASLANRPRLFPPSVVEMVAVAEETGRLDKELIRVANSYELDLDRQLKLLVGIAEPVMLFLMALTIGTIVVGMLLPVFDIAGLVK